MKKQNRKKMYGHTATKIGFFVSFLFTIPYAVAAAVTLEVPFAAAGNNGVYSVSNLLEYIVLIYQFIVAAVAIAAVVMIMFAGLKWASAAGNSSMISDSKERIKGSIMGLGIALASYLILLAINPYLVVFSDLDFEDLEFNEVYTSSLTVMASGEICDDENLVSYLESLDQDLLDQMVSYASLPCITKETYTMLVGVLTDLKNSTPSDPYHGMKLTINGANRSYSQQKLYWDCYQLVKRGETCPDECRASNCSVAANPEKGRGSSHGLGVALDVSSNWIGAKASSAYHNSCVVNGGTASGCSTETYNHILILDQLMQDNGFARLCIEWWHYEVPGYDRECEVGDYQ